MSRTISFSSRGSFKKTERFLTTMRKKDIFKSLDQFGRQGVAALASATPVDSGLSAESWRYEVIKQRSSYSLRWLNSHVVNGTPVVIWIQYGHGTGTGGWVEGRDFINPAIQPIFDKIADSVWKEVTSA